jgi:ribosomal protein S18 acetylase RimI-like enzyme
MVDTVPIHDEIQLRRISIDEWHLFRELRLLALEEAAYAFSSKLADWQGVGDTEDRWRGRVGDVPLNIIAEYRGVRAGMVSGTAPMDGAVELKSLWVAPFARGHGVGDALVQAVVRWAREQGVVRVDLEVFVGNERAEALYRRNGFVEGGNFASDRKMICNLSHLQDTKIIL